MIKLECNHCGKEFSGERITAKYCSNSCKTLASRSRKAQEQKTHEYLVQQMLLEEQAKLKTEERQTKRAVNKANRELKAAEAQERACQRAIIHKEIQEREAARLAALEEEEQMANKEKMEKIEKEKEDAKQRRKEKEANIARRLSKEREDQFRLQLLGGVAILAGVNYLISNRTHNKPNKP
jgi:hypothetical protein